MEVIAPELETLPERCPEPDLLFRAFLVGDLLLCSAGEPARDALARRCVPETEQSWKPLRRTSRHSARRTDAWDRG